MSKGKDLKPHIGIFGRRNNGKSSIINMLVGQDVAIVSDFAGTTTDPVKKSVEIFGMGPAIIIDTAGIDDSGDLGEKRIERTMKVISTIDLAILVIVSELFGSYEKDLIKAFQEYQVPFVIFHNKADRKPLSEEARIKIGQLTNAEILDISTLNIDSLVPATEVIKKVIPKSAYFKPSLFEGMIKPKDLVLLVTPIDSEAPEGRMILPQQMAIRDVLDQDALCLVVKETELADVFDRGLRPALVVTDSQAFGMVSKIVPEDIPLTGFSVLFARIRANFDLYLKGTPTLSELKSGDRVLILESCSHHVSCDDIGRVKLPKWISEFSGKGIQFDVVAGQDPIPGKITDYALVVQCGGCVVTQKQLAGRLKPAVEAGIPVTNYGLSIAYMNGVFDRAVEPMSLKTTEQ
ncbi:MAG: [FeFe] hydrogenase H-cluster maturation GTPase HydF [Bacteroidetes bacterium]|nr:[FeFe] hydrogenase H-cluster maturation GTPase HydF [Bacteroidota bacterium]